MRNKRKETRAGHCSPPSGCSPAFVVQPFRTAEILTAYPVDDTHKRIAAVTVFQFIFAKLNLAFNGNAVLFVNRLSCINRVYSIVHCRSFSSKRNGAADSFIIPPAAPQINDGFGKPYAPASSFCRLSAYLRNTS